MSEQPFEKQVTYGQTKAFIRIPEEPTGLAFIAPGAQVGANDPLMRTIRDSYEDRGMATVIADLGQSELQENDAFNVHADFTTKLQQVIDGYMADNDYTPDSFELAGHSMGGAAAITVANHNPVSSLTVLDPTPMSDEQIKDVDCPTTMILSKVRSFNNSGKRMYATLEDSGMANGLHELDTSKDRSEGHLFEGANIRHNIASIIFEQGASNSNIAPSDDTPNNTP